MFAIPFRDMIISENCQINVFKSFILQYETILYLCKISLMCETVWSWRWNVPELDRDISLIWESFCFFKTGAFGRQHGQVPGATLLFKNTQLSMLQMENHCPSSHFQKIWWKVPDIQWFPLTVNSIDAFTSASELSQQTLLNLWNVKAWTEAASWHLQCTRYDAEQSSV